MSIFNSRNLRFFTVTFFVFFNIHFGQTVVSCSDTVKMSLSPNDDDKYETAVKLPRLSTNICDLSPNLLSNVHGFGQSPNILQYLTIPPLHDQLDNSSAFRPVVLPSNQFMIPSSPQLHYILPGLKLRSSTSSDS